LTARYKIDEDESLTQVKKEQLFRGVCELRFNVGDKRGALDREFRIHRIKMGTAVEKVKG
jgi:hypothetical protein